MTPSGRRARSFSGSHPSHHLSVTGLSLVPGRATHAPPGVTAQTRSRRVSLVPWRAARSPDPFGISPPIALEGFLWGVYNTGLYMSKAGQGIALRSKIKPHRPVT